MDEQKDIIVEMEYNSLTDQFEAIASELKHDSGITLAVYRIVGSEKYLVHTYKDLTLDNYPDEDRIGNEFGGGKYIGYLKYYAEGVKARRMKKISMNIDATYNKPVENQSSGVEALVSKVLDRVTPAQMPVDNMPMFTMMMQMQQESTKMMVGLFSAIIPALTAQKSDNGQVVALLKSSVDQAAESSKAAMSAFMEGMKTGQQQVSGQESGSPYVEVLRSLIETSPSILEPIMSGMGGKKKHDEIKDQIADVAKHEDKYREYIDGLIERQGRAKTEKILKAAGQFEKAKSLGYKFSVPALPNIKIDVGGKK